MKRCIGKLNIKDIRKRRSWRTRRRVVRISMINIINRIYTKTKKPRKKCIKNVNDN